MRSISKYMKAVLLSTLMWGGQAVSAKVHCPTGQDTSAIDTIQDWVSHLNFYHPALDLKISGDLSQASVRGRIEAELRLLEDALLGTVSVPDRYLKMLACNQPRCGGGGGGGGNCTTCLTDTVEPDVSF